MPENNTYSPDLSDFSASAMTPKRMPASAPAPASGTEPYPPLLGRILSERGFSQTILAGDREYLVPMPGRFNGENALAAIAVCRSLGVQESEIAAGLLAVSVPGRTERYPAAHAPFEIVLDYAHNGESFRALFAALRPHTKGRILAVFGAGGDRPKLRRTDMGRAAAEGADLAILTEDNPRSEKTEDICRQIGAAIGERIPWLILPDRAEAIRFALRMAQPGDAVALLGKGHETYIEENGVRRYFSEREVLDQWFAGSRAGSKGAEQSS